MNNTSAHLLAWSHGQRPHLPWRGEDDPYRVWVSEIMLQQTRTETVAPYYARFLERFPTVRTLADADTDDVLKAWEGMGYYTRAHNLQRAARLVVANYDGQIPKAVEELRSLPGIGEYTAAAIASLAFSADVAALDGNGRRVLCRLYAIADDPARPAVQRRLRELAQGLLPPGRAGDFNVALMDLGATICTPRSPACPRCPLSPDCLAHAQGIAESLPVKAAKRPLPHYDMVAGMIWRDGQLLIAQRPPRGLLGGLWALPGGRREGEESLAAALARSVWEGLGVEIVVKSPVAVVEHAYTHFRITLHGFKCRYVGGEPEARGYVAWRWVGPEELAAFAFPVAERKVMGSGGAEGMG